MKRLYQQVCVKPVEGGFRIFLDEHMLHSPAKHPFFLPNLLLAQEIAQEWRRQTQNIRPKTMPMTCLASTALDRVNPHVESVIKEILSFFNRDLLLYWADQPYGISMAHKQHFEPLLAWMSARFDIELIPSFGRMPVEQSPLSLDRLNHILTQYSGFELAGLQSLTLSYGSAILALSVLDGYLDAKTALKIALVDEYFYLENWGSDDELSLRHDLILKEVLDSGRFLKLCKSK